MAADRACVSALYPIGQTSLRYPQIEALRCLSKITSERGQSTWAHDNQCFLVHCYARVLFDEISYTYLVLLRRHNAMAPDISIHFTEVYLKRVHLTPVALYILFRIPST